MMKYPSLLLCVVLLTACGEETTPGPSQTVDMGQDSALMDQGPGADFTNTPDAGPDDMTVEDMSPQDVTPEDINPQDAEQDQALEDTPNPPRDMAGDTADASPDMDPDMTPDVAPDTNEPPEETPWGELVTLEADPDDNNDFVAQLPFVMESDGILALRVRRAQPGDRNVTVSLCIADECDRLSNTRDNDAPAWVSSLYYMELATGTQGFWKLEASSREDASSLTVPAQLDMLPWQEDTTTRTGWADRQAVEVPFARRGTRPEDGTESWFSWDAPTQGHVRIITPRVEGGNDIDDAYLCDIEQYRGIPSLCPASADNSSFFDVQRAGPQYILASMFERQGEPAPFAFFALFDPAPDVPVCSAQEHLDGANACVPLEQCAPGFHDGGWGDCVPEEVCDNHFALTDEGHCAGWLLADALPTGLTPRSGLHDFTPLTQGRVLVQAASTQDDQWETYVFDPQTAAWTRSPITQEDRLGLTACPLSDGRALILKRSGEGDDAPQEYIYDPMEATWDTLENPSGEFWSRSSCTLMDNGDTLIVQVDKTFAFSPQTEAWRRVGDGLSGSQEPHTHLGPTGTVFAAAAFASSTPSRSLWALSPGQAAWARTSGWPHNTALYRFTQFYTDQNSLLVFHGEGRQDQPNTDAARYNIADDTWTALNPLPDAYMTNMLPYQGQLVTYQRVRRSLALYNSGEDTWQDLGATTPGEMRALTQHEDRLFALTKDLALRFYITP